MFREVFFVIDFDDTLRYQTTELDKLITNMRSTLCEIEETWTSKWRNFLYKYIEMDAHVAVSGTNCSIKLQLALLYSAFRVQTDFDYHSCFTAECE